MTFSMFLIASAVSLSYMTPDQVFDVEVPEHSIEEPQIGEAEFMESHSESGKPVFYRSGEEVMQAVEEDASSSAEATEDKKDINVFEEVETIDETVEPTPEPEASPEEMPEPEQAPELHAAPVQSQSNWMSAILYGTTGLTLVGAGGFGIWKLRV